MRAFGFVVLIILLMASFLIHLLGLMFLVPIYITSPLLFISLLLLLVWVNNRNKFKGFR